jgi:tetratricopeptide (TPR) repeat protein
MDQYEEAIKKFTLALNYNPEYLPSYLYLAVIYSESGRLDKAAAAGEQIERLSPQFARLDLWQRIPYKDKAIFDRILEGLARVGFK